MYKTYGTISISAKEILDRTQALLQIEGEKIAELGFDLFMYDFFKPEYEIPDEKYLQLDKSVKGRLFANNLLVRYNNRDNSPIFSGEIGLIFKETLEDALYKKQLYSREIDCYVENIKKEILIPNSPI